MARTVARRVASTPLSADARQSSQRRRLRHRGLSPSTSRWTSRSACRASRWSACPTPAFARAATACGARSAIRASSFRRIASPSTSRRPTSARRGRRSTCRSRSASSPRTGVVDRREIADWFCSASCRSTARSSRRAACCRLPRRPGATACRASCCRAPNAAEAAVVARSAASSRCRSLAEARRGAQRAASVAAAAAAVAPRRGAAGCRARGLRRRSRPGAGAARARDRRGRRTQPAAHRSARRRQDDAGAAAAGHPAAADVRRGARGRRRSIRWPGCCRPAPGCCRERPFRAPHHTISDVALVGGGSIPRPGEISLAHHGVLFLDEMPEFNRRALEVLRQPLEEGRVAIARAARTAVFPARFMLVGAMNPVSVRLSRAMPPRRAAARRSRSRAISARLSGPLRDRLDLTVDVPRAAGASSRHGSRRRESSAAYTRARGRGARTSARADWPSGGAERPQLKRRCCARHTRARCGSRWLSARCGCDDV